METSPFLHPGFIVPTALGLIGFIAWLIRLESKVNDLDNTVGKHEKHVDNDAIHFDQRLAQEVQARQGERIGRIEADVKEIKEMVKGLVAR